MIRTKTAMTQISKMGFHPFHHDGQPDVVSVSAEYDDNAADYWRPMPGVPDYNDPWINPKLEAWAEKHDLFWEWDNPGSISAYPV